jgi:prenyltransferase beta subunit
MLQVARLAPKLLGESDDLVKRFLQGQQNPDGGFKDRAGQSDLYYTVFGLDGLIALQTEIPASRVHAYLSGFGTGEGLDFVHLCCMARSWAALQTGGSAKSLSPPQSWPDDLLMRIEGFRAADGGYNPTPGKPVGTVYGCFLALGAYQDCRRTLPNAAGLENCLQDLRTQDGAWANEPKLTVGSTNATAAAITILRHLGKPLPPAAGEWLLARCHAEGGFLAMPNAPMPDLLSTATALHALSTFPMEFDRIRERCLDFVDTLWTNEGSFHGHWGDDALDCEYTFYGLLALGHLAA